MHGHLWQFSDTFLLDIFEQIIPKRNKLYSLIVKLNFLTVGGIHHISLHFDVVIVLNNFPAIDVDELVISMFG